MLTYLKATPTVGERGFRTAGDDRVTHGTVRGASHVPRLEQEVVDPTQEHLRRRPRVPDAPRVRETTPEVFCGAGGCLQQVERQVGGLVVEELLLSQ